MALKNVLIAGAGPVGPIAAKAFLMKASMIDAVRAAPAKSSYVGPFVGVRRQGVVRRHDSRTELFAER